MHDYEVVVDDTTLALPARQQGRRAPPSRSPGRTGLISFRPRMSGVQQPTDGQRPRLGPEGQEDRHRHRRQRAQTTSQAGRRSARKVSNDLGGGTTAVTDRVAANTRRGQRARQVDAGPAGRRLLRGRRRRLRQPEDQGRRQGQDRRRRHAVRRHLHRHQRPRTPTAARTGYQTSFQISGRSSRTLLELMRPPQGARLVGLARGRRGDQQQRPGPDGPRARQVPVAVGHRGERLGADRHARAPATRAAS